MNDILDRPAEAQLAQAAAACCVGQTFENLVSLCTRQPDAAPTEQMAWLCLDSALNAGARLAAALEPARLARLAEGAAARAREDVDRVLHGQACPAAPTTVTLALRLGAHASLLGAQQQEQEASRAFEATLAVLDPWQLALALEDVNVDRNALECAAAILAVERDARQCGAMGLEGGVRLALAAGLAEAAARRAETKDDAGAAPAWAAAAASAIVDAPLHLSIQEDAFEAEACRALRALCVLAIRDPGAAPAAVTAFIAAATPGNTARTAVAWATPLLEALGKLDLGSSSVQEWLDAAQDASDPDAGLRALCALCEKRREELAVSCPDLQTPSALQQCGLDRLRSLLGDLPAWALGGGEPHTTIIPQPQTILA